MPKNDMEGKFNLVWSQLQILADFVVRGGFLTMGYIFLYIE